jgi:hypothetical protein
MTEDDGTGRDKTSTPPERPAAARHAVVYFLMTFGAIAVTSLWGAFLIWIAIKLIF